MRWQSVCVLLFGWAEANTVPSFLHGNETTLHSFKCNEDCCKQYAACGGGAPSQLAQCLAVMPSNCYVAVNATYIFRHNNELCIGRDSLGIDFSFLQKGPARMISDLIVWHATFAANYFWPEPHYQGLVFVDDYFRRRLNADETFHPPHARGGLRADQQTPLTSEDEEEPWDPAEYLPSMEEDDPRILLGACKYPDYTGVPKMDYYKSQGIPFTYHNAPMRDDFAHKDFNYDTLWLALGCDKYKQFPFNNDWVYSWSPVMVYHTDVFNAGCVGIPRKGIPMPIVLRSFRAEWPYADDRAANPFSPVSTLLAAQYDPIDTDNPVLLLEFDNPPELQLHMMYWDSTPPFINATIESSFFGSNTPTL